MILQLPAAVVSTLYYIYIYILSPTSYYDGSYCCSSSSTRRLTSATMSGLRGALLISPSLGLYRTSAEMPVGCILLSSSLTSHTSSNQGDWERRPAESWSPFASSHLTTLVRRFRRLLDVDCWNRSIIRSFLRVWEDRLQSPVSAALCPWWMKHVCSRRAQTCGTGPGGDIPSCAPFNFDTLQTGHIFYITIRKQSEARSYSERHRLLCGRSKWRGPREGLQHRRGERIVHRFHHMIAA